MNNAVPYVSGSVIGKDGRLREQLLTDGISRKNIPMFPDDVCHILAQKRVVQMTEHFMTTL